MTFVMNTVHEHMICEGLHKAAEGRAVKSFHIFLYHKRLAKERLK